MDKDSWKKRIKASCRKAGTYQKYYDDVISSLAEILEKRDQAEQAYLEDGSQPLVEYTNKAGATNYTKNPALILWNDFNASALAYWRDLGLTPAGLKRLDSKPITNNESALEKAMRELREDR